MKIGFFVGSVLSFIPLMTVIYVLIRLVSTVAGWLSALVYNLRLPLPGNFGIEVNVIELLKLQDFYESLLNWAALGGFSAFLIALLLTFLAGLFWGLLAALGGVVFNLIGKVVGGIQVTMAEETGLAKSMPGQFTSSPSEVQKEND